MNMITYFNTILEKNFNKYLKNYFEEHNYYSKLSDFNNYYTFINDLDMFSDSFMKELLKSYLEDFAYVLLLKTKLENILLLAKWNIF